MEDNKPQEQAPQKPKHPGGRPTKYDPKLADKVHQYIDAVMEKRKNGVALPTIEMFAFNMNIDTDTVTNWANEKVKDANGNDTKQLAHPEFFGAIKRLKEFQKHLLMYDGLYGGKNVNSTMAIFLLKANHEMIETQHIDHTTKGKEMPQPIMGGVTDVSEDNSNEQTS